MKIVIVGGGTAGWLTALFIAKIQRGAHDLTMIESSKIPIIGAGEGSTGHLRDVVCNNLWDFGCDQNDFFRETDATIKLGIKHQNWTPRKDWYYYGPIDGSSTGSQVPDYHFCHAVAETDPNKIHLITQLGTLLDDKKTTFFTPTTTTSNHAYHFNAFKVGQYFKKVCGDDVKNIDAEVDDVILDSITGEIRSVKLSNGTEISADFFVDATGFARILMKKLENKWISYAKHLPVDSAMPFLVPYEEDTVIEPVTTALAMDSGWMWQIPTQERYGCGYVFDSSFITPEKAQEEIETKLGRKIEPIRVLKFDSGRLEEPWKKNCLSIGLAAAFSEPLEATSIHATIIQLLAFAFEYLKDTKNETVNSGSAYMYNRRINGMYDNFREFLEIHYAGGRTDTDFWKYMSSGETRSDFVQAVIDNCRTRVPNGTEFSQNYGYAGWSLWAFVLAGLGYITPEIARKELAFYGHTQDGKDVYDYSRADWLRLSSKMMDMTSLVRAYQKINNIGG